MLLVTHVKNSLVGPPCSSVSSPLKTTLTGRLNEKSATVDTSNHTWQQPLSRNHHCPASSASLHSKSMTLSRVLSLDHNSYPARCSSSIRQTWPDISSCQLYSRLWLTQQSDLLTHLVNFTPQLRHQTNFTSQGMKFIQDRRYIAAGSRARSTAKNVSNSTAGSKFSACPREYASGCHCPVALSFFYSDTAPIHSGPTSPCPCPCWCLLTCK